jgi:hypothetical protein
VDLVNGTVIYIRDVAHVRDGFQVQTNIVRQDGRRGSLLSVYKTGEASTLDIVRQVRDAQVWRSSAGLYAGDVPKAWVLLPIVDLDLPLPFALVWRKDNRAPLLAKFVADVRLLPEVKAFGKG